MDGHRVSVNDLVVLADGTIVLAAVAATATRTQVCGAELGLVHEFDLDTAVVRREPDLHEGRVRRVRFIARSWWSVGDDGRVLLGVPGWSRWWSGRRWNGRRSASPDLRPTGRCCSSTPPARSIGWVPTGPRTAWPSMVPTSGRSPSAPARISSPSSALAAASGS